MAPSHLLMLLAGVFGGLAGWAMKRLHGAWFELRSTRAKMPGLRRNAMTHGRKAALWAIAAVVFIWVLIR